MTNVIHVVATSDPPYGWYAESPQIPGFVMARDTQSELATDLPGVLREVLPADEAYRVIGHRQARLVIDGQPDALLRAEEGPLMKDRTEALARFEYGVRDGDQAGFLSEVHKGLLGDVLVIGVAATDTVRSVAAQMDHHDGAAVIALSIEANGVWATQIAIAGGEAFPGWREVSSYGWGDDTTMLEIYEGMTAGAIDYALSGLLVPA